jgi:glycosyltransferase involved in cell wall biosynthesis
VSVFTRHVLMTADAVGGVWTYALDLADGLAAFGVRTTLAVAGPKPSAAQLAEAAAIPGLGLVDTGLPLDWTAETPEAVSLAGERLAGLAAELRPDLVHLNSPAYAASPPFPVPVVGVAHSCVATWWAAVRAPLPLPEDFRWRAALVAEGYAGCDVLLAPTRAFAEATARAYGRPAPLVTLNGRRNPASAPASAGPAPSVFTAGRLWDDGKNVAVLDSAAARLGTPVYAAGPVIAPHGEVKWFPHLRLLGTLDERAVAGWLASRPIFVSTALYEPFGLAVLEAAQAGCALVLSDIPTFRELWEGAALFVDPKDAHGLAAAVGRLAENPARREALAEAARARSQRYGADAMTRGVLHAYGRAAPHAFAEEAAA